MTSTDGRTIGAMEAMTDFVRFEMLYAEILSTHPAYSTLAPQGIGRRDGGKDAIGRILGPRRAIGQDQQSVSWLTEGQVFHFSLRQDVERKIFEDLANTRRHRLQPELVVFATNRRVLPDRQDAVKARCREVFGWPLEIHDQEWLRVRLDTEWQSVRKRYLGIDYDCTVFRTLDELLNLSNSRRYFARADLESGAYFRRAALNERLSQLMDQDRVALVIGRPGHGKTALALSWAWEWQRKSARREAFYLSARKDGDWRRWEQDIHAQDHADNCFIIDDAHVQADAVSELAQSLGAFQQARILIVGRPFPDSLRRDNDDYQDLLADKCVEVTTDVEEWSAIIASLVQRQDLALGNADRILERCGGDLFLLRHLLSAWARQPEPRPTVADVPEDAVDRDVLARYLGQTDGAEARADGALLSLAALGQFEIPAESRWLAGRSGWRESQQEGWAELDVQNCYGVPFEFADFFHSTPATLLLDAAYRQGILAQGVEDHTLACLRSYLDGMPGNATSVLQALYRHGVAHLQRAVLSADYASRLVSRLPISTWPGLADATFVLYALWRQEGSPDQGGAARSLWAQCKLQLGSDLPGGELGLELLVGILFRIRKLDEDYFAGLPNRLDLAKVGRGSSAIGLATVMNFLSVASRAGGGKELSRAFCSGLNFGDLGKRSSATGLATVSNFLNASSRAGVGKEQLRAFCSGLNFGDLGKRSSAIGLATATTFLSVASRARVDKEQLRVFCLALDFAWLGEHVGGASLSTVMTFMREVARSGVGSRSLSAFAGKLDWAALGAAMRAGNDGSRRAYLIELIWVAKNAGISRLQARGFMEGWGWEDIRQAVATLLGGDSLAALLDLLRNRCAYSHDELVAKGIRFRANRLWLRAFTERPAGTLSGGEARFQVSYFASALQGLDDDMKLDTNFFRDLTLRQWSILAHNLNLADPARLDSLYWPHLERLSKKDWQWLYSEADVMNTGIWFSRFGPEGMFAHRRQPFPLPDAQVLLPRIGEATVLETAHLLLNLSLIGGVSVVANLAHRWQEDAADLPSDFSTADLHPLGHLGWTMMIARPDGQWLDHGVFASKWRARLMEMAEAVQGAPTDWLGLRGLYALAERTIPTLLPLPGQGNNDPASLEDAMTKTFAEPDFKVICRLAGMLSLFPGRLSHHFRENACTALRTLPKRGLLTFQEEAKEKVLSQLAAEAEVVSSMDSASVSS